MSYSSNSFIQKYLFGEIEMKIKFIRFVSISVTIFMLLSTFALLSLCVGATAEESVLTQATTADN